MDSNRGSGSATGDRTDFRGETISIRPARPDEIDVLMEMVRAVVRQLEADGIHQWDDVYPDRVVLRDDVERRDLSVIAVDGAIAGMIVLNEDQPPEYGELSWRGSGRVLVIHRLIIHPDRQRRRLAVRLIEFAEASAAARGYDSIRLDAFTANPAAVALYERSGYRKAGTVKLRKGPFFCFEKPVKP